MINVLMSNDHTKIVRDYDDGVHFQLFYRNTWNRIHEMGSSIQSYLIHVLV